MLIAEIKFVHAISDSALDVQISIVKCVAE